MVLIPRIRYERLLASDNDVEREAMSTEQSTAPDKSTGKSTHTSVDISVEKPKDKPVDKSQDKSEDKPVDKTVDKTVDKSEDKSEDKTVDKTVDKPSVAKGSTKNFNVHKKTKKAKLTIESILYDISQNQKEPAERVLKYIQDKGGNTLSWNGRGRLLYEGTVMNGSNISELVTILVSNKKQHKKSALYKSFRKGLVKINMPLSLLKSADSANGDKTLKKKWISY